MQKPRKRLYNSPVLMHKTPLFESSVPRFHEKVIAPTHTFPSQCTLIFQNETELDRRKLRWVNRSCSPAVRRKGAGLGVFLAPLIPQARAPIGPRLKVIGLQKRTQLLEKGTYQTEALPGRPAVRAELGVSVLKG